MRGYVMVILHQGTTKQLPSYPLFNQQKHVNAMFNRHYYFISCWTVCSNTLCGYRRCMFEAIHCV